MITVKADLEGDEMSFSMHGHANYNPGNDIVCAGCSAICYALLGMLANLQDHIESLDTIEESGNVEVLCVGDEMTKMAFTMAVVGILQIEKKYPNYVRVIE